MDRNTANVSFYCRESKKNKDGMAPIELSLVINGKRCYVQLLNTHRLLVQEFIHSALDLYIDHASIIINGELYVTFPETPFSFAISGYSTCSFTQVAKYCISFPRKEGCDTIIYSGM